MLGTFIVFVICRFYDCECGGYQMENDAYLTIEAAEQRCQYLNRGKDGEYFYRAIKVDEDLTPEEERNRRIAISCDDC